MQLEILLFAAARDAAGSDSIKVEVADDARARDVIRAVGERVPGIDRLLPSCRLAVDCAYVDDRAPVSPDVELALIPPVSGG